MRPLALPVLATCLIVAGCATPADRAQKAQQALLGLSQQQLVDCAGPPDASNGNLFVWKKEETRYVGGSTLGLGPVELSTPFGRQSVERMCRTSIRMDAGGHASNVLFDGYGAPGEGTPTQLCIDRMSACPGL
ncbi:hypothetical protein [Radicibacter daui]|uniref:hypothetical protein n=1 Tax=Radicibacter daui TaxID=3064829 RepID=UPI004046BE58